MRIKFVVVAQLSLMLVLTCDSEQLRLNVAVNDERGLPITNAIATVRAMNRTGLNAGAFASDYSDYSATTDSNGVANVVFDSLNNRVDVRVKAEGCYSSGNTSLTYKATVVSDFKLRFLEYEKTVTVPLCRKRHPVPLRGMPRDVDIPLPGRVGSFGFDMSCGDWIAPYGGGLVPDFVIEFCTTNLGDRIHSGGTIRFPHGGAYKVAVQKNRCIYFSGYEAETNRAFCAELAFGHDFILTNRLSAGMQIADEDEMLVVRSREVRDESGKIVSANYSRIIGVFGVMDSIRWVEGGWLEKKYLRPKLRHGGMVFNPTPNDPNLEDDGTYRKYEKVRRNQHVK